MFFKLIFSNNNNLFLIFFIKLGFGKLLLKNYIKNSKQIFFVFNVINYKIFWKNKLLNYYNLYINYSLYINYIGYSLNSIILIFNLLFKKKKNIIIKYILSLYLNLLNCYCKSFFIN